MWIILISRCILGLIQCWDLKSGELVGGQKPEPNAKHTYVDMLYVSSVLISSLWRDNVY